MPRGVAVLLLVLLTAGGCGGSASPALRGDVERGTALPPPGFNAAATATTVRR